MRVSFKDINGIKVEGRVEYIYPRLSQDGKIHSWYFCMKLEDGRFIKGVCYEIEDCKFTLDEDESPALYPRGETMKIKEEISTETATKLNTQHADIKILTEKNMTLQEQNERVCKENEELKEKLAKYKNCIDCLKTIIEVFKER